MATIRVKCSVCGEVCRVTKSREQSPTVKHLYCQCSDVDCGHTFVEVQSFGYTISPSRHVMSEEVQKIVSKSTPNEQISLFSILEGKPHDGEKSRYMQ